MVGNRPMATADDPHESLAEALDRVHPELGAVRDLATEPVYLVGGAVRDLLVGLRPKDFDVATNATPEQVKGLFRRAFIIGRRFRIVHVVYGRGREHEVIEVSTFRAYMDSAAAEQVAGNEKSSKSELAGMKHAVDASGRVLRDNVWGPQDEDAARRDFTINALSVSADGEIYDYVGGLADIAAHRVRFIGDPKARMGVGRAQHQGMQRGQRTVVIRIPPFAANQGVVFLAQDALPDAELHWRSHAFSDCDLEPF